MSIKTVRFNRQEEALLKKILAHYGKDFSSCIKALFREKMEDLKDQATIKGIKEGKQADYLTADKLESLFED